MAQAGTASFKGEGLELIAAVDENHIVANGELIHTGTPVRLLGGRVYVPVRALAKALGAGLAAAAAAFALLFDCGLLFGQGQIDNGLEAAKDGLLVVASLGLFIVAGMLMTGGKKEKKFSEKNGWRRHFAVLGPKAVLGVLSAAFLLAASIADYLLMCS